MALGGRAASERFSAWPDRGFDAPGADLLLGCRSRWSDFRPDSPGLVLLAPAGARRRARLLHRDLPRRRLGRRGRARPSSCRTTTRARAAARCAGSTSRRTPARASSCASRAAACSTSSSTCAAARPRSASGRASSSTTSTATSSTSRSGSGTASACSPRPPTSSTSARATTTRRPRRASASTTPTSASRGRTTSSSSTPSATATRPRLAEVADALPFRYDGMTRATAASRRARRARCTSATCAPRCSRGCSRARPARASSCGWRTSTRAASQAGAAERQLARPARDRARLGRRGRLPVQPPPTPTRRRSSGCSPPADLYECFCTRAEIRAAASAPHGPLPEGAYPGTCLRLTEAERRRKRAGGRPPALRVRAGAARVGVHRPRCTATQEGVVDDFVVRRNDGAPAYNLAVVVDDAWQGIGEVVRGDDLLDSTPRQLFLAGAARAAGARATRTCRSCSGPDGARLAKRHGAVTLDELDAGRGACAGWRATLGMAGARDRGARCSTRFDPAALPREPTRWSRHCRAERYLQDGCAGRLLRTPAARRGRRRAARAAAGADPRAQPLQGGDGRPQRAGAAEVAREPQRVPRGEREPAGRRRRRAGHGPRPVVHQGRADAVRRRGDRRRRRRLRRARALARRRAGVRRPQGGRDHAAGARS